MASNTPTTTTPAPTTPTITTTTTATSHPSLSNLPVDLTQTIATFLPPSSLLSLSTTCRTLRPLSLSSEIWSRLSHTHFPSPRSAPPVSRSSLTSFLALAAGASSRWRVAMGAIVADTPAHVRGGCAVAVRTRGGADRVLTRDSCAEMDQRGFYVVQIGAHGGPAAAALGATAGSPRAADGWAAGAMAMNAQVGMGEVEMDWRWKEAFPKDGVVVRVVCGLVGGEAVGGVDVVVNGVVVGEGVRVRAADGREVLGEVGVVEVGVKPELLKGVGDGVNVVAVKWTAGEGECGTWWVSEVEVLPKITSERKGFDEYEAVGQTLPIAIARVGGRADVNRRGVRMWEKNTPMPGSPTSVFGF